MRDLFEVGHVDIAIYAADVPQGVVHRGLQHHRAQRRPRRAASRASSWPTPASTRATARPAWTSSRRTSSAGTRKGAKLYTAEWKDDSRGWKLSDPEAYTYLAKAQELGIKNIHVHKGPTIWPLDKDAFDVSDVDHAATDFPELNFIVEHVGLPTDRGLLLHGDPGAQRVRRAVGGDRRTHARPAAVLRQGDGRAAVLGRRGQDDLRQRLRHLGAEVAGRGLRRLGDARRRRVLRLPAPRRRGQEEDPRPQRRPALRHRGARGVPRSRTPRRRPRATTRSWCPAARRPHERPDRPGPRRAGAPGPRHGARPRAGRAGDDARVRGVVSRRGRRGRGAPTAADVLLRAQLRVPDGGGRASTR